MKDSYNKLLFWTVVLLTITMGVTVFIALIK